MQVGQQPWLEDSSRPRGRCRPRRGVGPGAHHRGRTTRRRAGDGREARGVAGEGYLEEPPPRTTRRLAARTRGLVRPRAKAAVPDRGDVVWLDFTPQAGHEQARRRPGVVLSPAAYNGKVGLALVCPITTQAKGYPFEVPIPAEGPVTGVILADQVKSVDWRARRAKIVDRLEPSAVAKTLALLSVLL